MSNLTGLFWLIQRPLQHCLDSGNPEPSGMSIFRLGPSDWTTLSSFTLFIASPRAAIEKHPDTCPVRFVFASV